MHELSLAKNIVATVSQSLEGIKGVKRVKSIKLKVGRIHVLSVEALDFCFKLMSEGTPLEGAELEVQEVPLTARCEKCGEEFELDGYLFVCPRCGSPEIKVIRGEELLIESFEIVKEDENGDQGLKEDT